MWHHLHALWYRVTASLRRRRLDRDLDDELAFHVAMRQGDLVASGAEADQARLQAERRFGNRTRVKEDMRDMWTFPLLENLSQAVAYALRTHCKEPVVTATIVVVLAAVIGLNSTLFTVMAGIALRPWSGVVNPDEVVRLYLEDSVVRPTGFSLANATTLESATSLAGVAVMKNEVVRVGSSEQLVGRQALMVGGNFFSLLGISFAEGRGFSASEDRIGAPEAVAIISYGYWQSQFGRAPGVVGSSLRINDVAFTIVGVVSPEFGSAEPAYDKHLFLPMSALALLNPNDPSIQRFLHDSDACCVDVVARLAPGADRVSTEAELDVRARVFKSMSGNAAAGVVMSGTEFLSQPGRGNSANALTTGVLLITALLLVWLIACANVGNLLLSRAAARIGEIGTRLALGASRGRIVYQLLIEGLTLALAAGVVGVLIAYQLPFVLFGFVAESGTIGFPFSVRPDALVLGYAVTLAGLSSIAFGLAPALYITRADVVSALKSRDVFPSTTFPLRSALLAVQAAISVILLVSAGLLIRGVQRQSDVFNPGLSVEGVTAVSFEMPEGDYTRERTIAFFDQLARDITTLPIERAAFASHDPFSRYRHGTVFHFPGEDRQHARQILFENVSTGYFALLNIPLRAGRYFEDAERAVGPVIINESMARRFWPGESPIGKILLMRPRGPVDTMEPREIIGVVQDVHSTTAGNVAPMFYQLTVPGSDVFGFLGRDPRASQPPALLVKADSDVTAMVGQIAARLDERVKVQAAPLSDSLDAMLATARWGPILAAALGVFALALTTVGVAGVFAYSVRQQRREIGIRMALGAAPPAVVRMVLTRHTRALAIGLAIGLLGSIAASIVLRNRLHGLSPFDPVAYVSVALLLAFCALLAGVVPARRATSINPLGILRQI